MRVTLRRRTSTSFGIHSRNFSLWGAAMKLLRVLIFCWLICCVSSLTAPHQGSQPWIFTCALMVRPPCGTEREPSSLRIAVRALIDLRDKMRQRGFGELINAPSSTQHETASDVQSLCWVDYARLARRNCELDLQGQPRRTWVRPMWPSREGLGRMGAYWVSRRGWRARCLDAFSLPWLSLKEQKKRRWI